MSVLLSETLSKQMHHLHLMPKKKARRGGWKVGHHTTAAAGLVLLRCTHSHPACASDSAHIFYKEVDVEGPVLALLVLIRLFHLLPHAPQGSSSNEVFAIATDSSTAQPPDPLVGLSLKHRGSSAAASGAPQQQACEC